MTSELSSRSTRTALTNARVVTPNRVIDDGYVVIEDGAIADVGHGSPGAVGRRVETEQKLVMPGIVDLHGDDVERYRFPRSNADVGAESALVSCDRGNLAAGITTKFHAVAFEDAPEDHRSVTLAKEMTDAIDTAEGLLGNVLVNARCEVGEVAAVDAVRDVLDRDAVGLVSLMNHLPDCGQFADSEAFERRYSGEVASTDGVEGALRNRRRVRPEPAAGSHRRLVRACRDAGIPLASHDDETTAAVDAMADLGVGISEFPVTKSAAHRATDHGLVTAMGAPNLVRGGSLWDNLSAAEAIRAGLVDVLCSDYHPPSLLASVFVDKGEPLPDRVARVTAAPAKAAGLEDRGRIEQGASADVIVVDAGPPPQIRRAFVDGEQVYRAAIGA